ncbi:flippase-like domain-containing protein [candidate division KSB1 bacterium]|nr:flippase-like domain-containing protein [candidate division KSB1 bacterium]
MQFYRKKILTGIRWFIFFTIIGITVIFYLTGTSETWHVLRDFRSIYLFWSLLLFTADLLLGALRIYIFLYEKYPRSFWSCFRANLANIFMGAATPFKTGGGPAQLYILHQEGVDIPASLNAGVLNFVAMLSLLFITATILLSGLTGRLTNSPTLLAALDISRFAFYIMLFGFILFVFHPKLFARAVERFSLLLEKKFPDRREKIQNRTAKILEFLTQYKRILGYYWRNRKSIHLLNIILTVLLLFTKCVMAYLVIRGMGFQANFGAVIKLQILIIFFMYFTPTPGGSFVAETGLSAMMLLILPAHALPVFVVLWRFFSTYIAVLMGSLVILKSLGKSGSKQANPA